MITLHPFRAWRPKTGLVEKVACVPYDVIDSEEARQLSSGNPCSFLHVIRPEIDHPPETDIYSDRVYETGAANLKRMQSEGLLIQEEEPSLYLYQQKMGEHIQTGIFGCVAVRDYDQNRILRHELTRPDKENDRTRHILAQRAHAEPVMLTCRTSKEFDLLVDSELSDSQPLYSYTAIDNVVHRLWKINKPKSFVEAFYSLETLYIADGHHRCKSASRAAEALGKGTCGSHEYNFFPAVIYPLDQMRILAYNRLVKKVPGIFFKELQTHFHLKKSAATTPSRPGEICLFFQGKWYSMDLPGHPDGNTVDQLDVSRLHTFLLKPLLGIENQRTDENLSFSGGIRGTEELERQVNSGRADLAISMFPTQIQDLLRVSDQQLLMPPKSTWFEPKLQSGLLIHTFE